MTARMTPADGGAAGVTKPPVSRADAKVIADTCVILADKALSWKQRALAAEEALSKFAAEVYGTPPRQVQP